MITVLPDKEPRLTLRQDCSADSTRKSQTRISKRARKNAEQDILRWKQSGLDIPPDVVERASRILGELTVQELAKTVKNAPNPIRSADFGVGKVVQMCPSELEGSRRDSPEGNDNSRDIPKDVMKSRSGNAESTDLIVSGLPDNNDIEGKDVVETEGDNEVGLEGEDVVESDDSEVGEGIEGIGGIGGVVEEEGEEEEGEEEEEKGVGMRKKRSFRTMATNSRLLERELEETRSFMPSIGLRVRGIFDKLRQQSSGLVKAGEAKESGYQQLEEGIEKLARRFPEH